MADIITIEDVLNSQYVKEFLTQEDIPAYTIIYKFDGDNYDSGIYYIKACVMADEGNDLIFYMYTINKVIDGKKQESAEDKDLSKKWRTFVYKKLEAIDTDLAEQYKDCYVVRGLRSMDKIREQIRDLESQLDEIKSTHF